MQIPFLLLGFMTAKDGSCKECDTIVLYHKNAISLDPPISFGKSRAKKTFMWKMPDLLEILFFSDTVKSITKNMFYKYSALRTD